MLEEYRMAKLKLNSEKIVKTIDPKMSNIVTFSALCSMLNNCREEGTVTDKSVMQAIAWM